MIWRACSLTVKAVGEAVGRCDGFLVGILVGVLEGAQASCRENVGLVARTVILLERSITARYTPAASDSAIDKLPIFVHGSALQVVALINRFLPVPFRRMATTSPTCGDVMLKEKEKV